MLRPRRAAWFAIVFLASGASPLHAEDASLPREEVEAIVRDYLMREPEVVYEAIQELQRRQQAAEAEERQQAVARFHGQIFEDPRDPVLGNPQGDVTMVEFFDYRCGYCRQMAPGLRSLIANDDGLRVVLKEFPILGPESQLAARAALAARQQGAYEEFHFDLMAEETIDPAVIERIAKDSGLDVAQLRQDMQSEETTSLIEENLQLAQALGINGTPSFIINDVVIPGAAPIADLAQVIVDQRRTLTD